MAMASGLCSEDKKMICPVCPVGLLSALLNDINSDTDCPEGIGATGTLLGGESRTQSHDDNAIGLIDADSDGVRASSDRDRDGTRRRDWKYCSRQIKAERVVRKAGSNDPFLGCGSAEVAIYVSRWGSPLS